MLVFTEYDSSQNCSNHYPNIIFLDIDGVLNNHSTSDIFKTSCDPVCFYHFKEALDSIKEVKDIKLVISSSWRGKSFSNFEYIIQETHSEKLKELYHFIHPDWRTLHFSEIQCSKEDYCRGVEIQNWLNKHPEVEKYIILDDNSDFLPNQNLLQTIYEFGFGIFEKEILQSYFLETSNKYAKYFGNQRIKITSKNMEITKKYQMKQM